jgi:hypothetical protein
MSFHSHHYPVLFGEKRGDDSTIYPSHPLDLLLKNNTILTLFIYHFSHI